MGDFRESAAKGHEQARFDKVEPQKRSLRDDTSKLLSQAPLKRLLLKFF